VSAWSAVYLAVYNSGEPRKVTVTVETKALGLPANPAVSELVENLQVTTTPGEGGLSVTLTIPSAMCRVVKLAP